MTIPQAIDGCEGCQGTSGIYSCPTHSPNFYVKEQPVPFVQLFIKCPHCEQGLQFDGYELKEYLNK